MNYTTYACCCRAKSGLRSVILPSEGSIAARNAAAGGQQGTLQLSSEVEDPESSRRYGVQAGCQTIGSSLLMASSSMKQQQQLPRLSSLPTASASIMREEQPSRIFCASRSFSTPAAMAVDGLKLPVGAVYQNRLGTGSMADLPMLPGFLGWRPPADGPNPFNLGAQAPVEAALHSTRMSVRHFPIRVNMCPWCLISAIMAWILLSVLPNSNAAFSKQRVNKFHA